MKKFIFCIVGTITCLYFINNLTASFSEQETGSIRLNKEEWQKVDNNIPEIPQNNTIDLTDAIYSYKDKSLGIYTSPDDDGYYHQTLSLKVTESFPSAIKRMFSNHYIYFHVGSGQLVA